MVGQAAGHNMAVPARKHDARDAPRVRAVDAARGGAGVEAREAVQAQRAARVPRHTRVADLDETLGVSD